MKLGWIAIWSLVLLGIFTCIFIWGYVFGFDDGKEAMTILNGFVSESQDFIFLCSEYSSPYYNCEHSEQFMNITGLYCNNRLVCQNELRDNIKEE